MSTTPAARTYARALLDASGPYAGQVADELEAVAALPNQSPREWGALIAPGVAASSRKHAIDALLTDGHVITRNTLKLLVDNGRLAELPELAREFRRVVRSVAGELDVHVTSAVELPDGLTKRLEERLSSNTGKRVTLHTSIDPSIIGGLIVQHGDTLVDTSLKGRLDSLRLALSKPTPRTAARED
ncbi:MAG: synthase delta chain [Thermoleophilia bacterium]|nr:synthase delta chain [Thermoleophilia bacterium]